MSDDLDTLTGQVFATEKGKEWLRRFGNHSSAHKSVCRDVEVRLRRMRVRWGDKSPPMPESE